MRYHTPIHVTLYYVTFTELNNALLYLRTTQHRLTIPLLNFTSPDHTDTWPYLTLSYHYMNGPYFAALSQNLTLPYRHMTLPHFAIPLHEQTSCYFTIPLHEQTLLCWTFTWLTFILYNAAHCCQPIPIIMIGQNVIYLHSTSSNITYDTRQNHTFAELDSIIPALDLTWHNYIDTWLHLTWRCNTIPALDRT